MATFKVRFYGGERCNLVKLDSFLAGLDFIDEAREFSDVPDLSLENIDNRCSSLSIVCIDIALTEDQARASGHFNTSGSTVKVSVVCVKPNGEEFHSNGGDLFCKVLPDVRKNSQTGEVTVGVEYVLDEGELLYHWIEAGYPETLNVYEEDGEVKVFKAT